MTDKIEIKKVYVTMRDVYVFRLFENGEQMPNEKIFFTFDEAWDRKFQLMASPECLICHGTGLIQEGYGRGFTCVCTENK